MVNYNYDEPADRGYWYDAVVTEKRNTRTIKELICTVNIGYDLQNWFHFVLLILIYI